MVVSVVGALIAFVLAQSATEPPAASRRPNLQVLTTVPESQLFPMMNAIADSLGVRCDHCHVRAPQDPAKPPTVVGGWEWARDDKQPKRVARDMMRMVLDINARQFGGRAVVTCHTCHRGSTAPLRFPALPPRDYSTIVDAPARTLPAIGDVWAKYIRAVGERPGGFSTLVLRGTDDRSEGRKGTIEVIFKGADRVRLTSKVPPDAPLTQVLTADGGWVASAGGSRAFRSEEVAGARRLALRYRPIKIDPPASWRVTGVERVGTREVYVALTDVDARTKAMWYFDVDTGLLIRERTTTETALVPLQSQIDYEDYRRVGGVMIPFRMRVSDGSPYSTSVRVFTSIRHDVAVEDSTFEKERSGAGGRIRFQ